MSIAVRRAAERDIPAIMALLKQVNRVHYEGRPDLFKLATKYTPDALRAILLNDETPVFVCVDGTGAVLGHGFCAMQRVENTQLMQDIRTLYIDDICVDEAARGQGVGRALYDHILDFAREARCYNVTLNVWSCNPGAMRFYEKLGLKPYKVGMEQIL
ncbi:MAG: GNAT family N-acetyltransferase [Clostridia bacterium]|nr:GNAT family N-acetyltransferase [Clostridia bacterium]